MSAAIEHARFDYAQVIVRAGEVLQRNLPLLATLTLVFYGLPKLGATLLDLGHSDLPIVGATLSATHGVYALVATVGFFAVQAMVVYVFVKDLEGCTPSFTGSLRHGLHFLAPVFCLFVVLAIAIVLGLILLVVPGLMIATAWLVATPALVVERIGVRAAIDRSVWLTRGYRWEIFAFVAVMLVLGFMLRDPFTDVDLPSGPFAVIGSVSAAAGALFEDLLEIVATLVSALLVSSIYCELRVLKEGVALEELAAQID